MQIFISVYDRDFSLFFTRIPDMRGPSEILRFVQDQIIKAQLGYCTQPTRRDIITLQIITVPRLTVTLDQATLFQH